MASDKERLAILQQMKQARADLNALDAKATALSKEELKLRERIKETIVAAGAELKSINNTTRQRIKDQSDTISYLASEEQSLKSLSGIQTKLKNIGKDRLRLIEQSAIRESVMTEKGRTRLTGIIDLTTQLSNLNAEDVFQKAELNKKLDRELSIFKRQRGVSDELLANLEKQRKEAASLSSITERDKQLLESQLDVYNQINNVISGTLNTAATLFRKPLALVGAISIGMGVIADRVGVVNRELGQSIINLDSASKSAIGLSFIFDDAVGTLKGIANEFGNMEKATLKLQASTNLIATNMGVSSAEASALIGSFSRLNSGSANVATDMVKTTQQFAKQRNVIPSDVLSDLAGSAEQFAIYGKAGGENLIRAAVGARQLGVNLQTVSGIADTLLDFESSITKELELGAMLGKNINLTRARGLAYEGDINGALRETLRQLGGIEEFNRMDYFQKKQTADLLGVSVSDLQKMAENQKNIGSTGQLIQEKFGIISESVNAIANKYLGTGLKGLGGWLTTLGQINMGMSALGVPLQKVTSFIWDGVKGLGSMVARLFKVQTLQTATSKGGAIGGGGKVISSVGKGVGGGIRGVAGGLASLANPATLVGLAAVTGAIIGLGFALKLAAPGIEAIGNSIGSVIRALGDFGKNLGDMVTPEKIGGIFLLAAAITSLSTSMALLAATSALALPAIAAISAVGAISGFVGQTLQNSGVVEAQSIDNKREEQLMLQELRGLRQDLNSGKIAVYMDGKEVTAKVATVSNRSTTNRGNSIFGG